MSKIYESLKQCAAAENIPVKHLSIARNDMGAPGFRSARVDWDVFYPWYEQHKGEIESLRKTDISEVKRQNAIKDGILKDLEIAAKRRQYIDPKEVEQWSSGLGMVLSTVIKRTHQELKSKCGGYERVIDEGFRDIYKIIKESVGKYGQGN